jgi:hypothetical protein
MLQKLENAYLAILRMTVIIVSGILLVGVIVFGISSLEYFNNSPNDEIKSIKVNSEDVIKKLQQQKKHQQNLYILNQI